jgi:hypothetical protein
VTTSPLDRLVVKLESITELTEHERRTVLSLPITLRDFQPDEDIVARVIGRGSAACSLRDSCAATRFYPTGSVKFSPFIFPATFPICRAFTSQ